MLKEIISAIDIPGWIDYFKTTLQSVYLMVGLLVVFIRLDLSDVLATIRTLKKNKGLGVSDIVVPIIIFPWLVASSILNIASKGLYRLMDRWTE